MALSLRAVSVARFVVLSLLGAASFAACGGDGDGATASTGPAGKAGAAGQGQGGGANAGKSGASGSGGSGGAGVIGSACTGDGECAAPVGVTPPGCAEAFCDKGGGAGRCALRARDVDGDGERAASCKGVGTDVITVGKDCNDADPAIFTGAWDGPAGDGKPERCNDGVDQNCSGADGDSVGANGTTCKCTPGDVSSCSEDGGGKPIGFPGGSPLGTCKKGAKTCGANGTFGPCVGAVGPVGEACDGADNDCDGVIDNSLAQSIWRYDGDGDGHGRIGASVTACAKPTTVPEGCTNCDAAKWTTAATISDDCDDASAATFPGATEICDGKDNDCDGGADDLDPESATGKRTYYRDADGDKHGDKATPAQLRCAPPGPEWLADVPADDCVDTDALVFPGSWDGPAATVANFGLTAPLAGEVFRCTDCANNPYATPLGPRTDYALSFDAFYGGLVASAADYFAARWTSKIVAAQTGEHTFHLRGDDGIRLTVAGTKIIDGWKAQAPTSYEGKITLQAGQEVDLFVEYFEAAYAATLVLEWEGPGIPRQLVRPKQAPASGERPDRCGDGRDNDCDGTTDNGVFVDNGVTRRCSSCALGTTRPCGAPLIVSSEATCHPGTQFCNAQGEWSACLAEGAPQATELCDLGKVDDNCNGAKNEGCACSQGDTQACGACGKGTQTCAPGGSWGPCVGDVAQELYCDDTDGDTHCTAACALVCVGSQASTQRPKTSCASNDDCQDTGPNAAKRFPTNPEVCDNVDNDCNGQVDENLLGPACTALPGTPCQESGFQLCVNGAFAPANCSVKGKPPTIEKCDGIDNDCDGSKDEGPYLGDANFAEGACFVCAKLEINTLSASLASGATVLKGDSDFTTPVKVSTRIELTPRGAPYEGEIDVKTCILAQETGGDGTVAQRCSTTPAPAVVAGQKRYVEKIISGPIGGTEAFGAITGYRYLYTDGTIDGDDAGSFSVPGTTFGNVGYTSNVLRTGGEINVSSNASQLRFQPIDCVTVKVKP